jgi:hypothetical protein
LGVVLSKGEFTSGVACDIDAQLGTLPASKASASNDGSNKLKLLLGIILQADEGKG